MCSYLEAKKFVPQRLETATEWRLEEGIWKPNMNL